MLEGLDIDDDRDMEIIDGWDVVDEESQEKIREALRVGHVADEEWKGVSVLLFISFGRLTNFSRNLS